MRRTSREVPGKWYGRYSTPSDTPAGVALSKGLRSVIDLLTAKLFRRHIAHRSHNQPLDRQGPSECPFNDRLFRKAEVENRHGQATPVISPTYDVFGFEIPVHDALRMCGAEALQDLIEPLRHVGHWHGANAVELGAKRRTVQSFHDDVSAFAFERPVIVHANDARMIQPGRGTRFPAEAAERRELAERAAQQNLHGNVACQP
jgi:hypothetical protein